MSDLNAQATALTPIDLELALAFYSVLVHQARRQETITYGQLVERAKEMFPSNATVQNAIPISAGRRLDFVRGFTRERRLPDLTSLVVNKATGECGVGFTRSFDPEDARATVFAHDWEGVSAEFTGAVAAARERSRPRKAITHEKALVLMSEYFMEHKATLSPSVRNHREQIIQLIMSGLTPGEAFAEVLK